MEQPYATLTFRNISHYYAGGKNTGCLALENVTIERVTPGEIIFIQGPNGAGKSTLVSKIAGYLQYRAGDGVIELNNGYEISPCDFDKLRRVFIPQKPQDGYIPQLSILENILIRSKLLGDNRGEHRKAPNQFFSSILRSIHLCKTVTEEGKRSVIEFIHEIGDMDWIEEKLDLSPEDLSGGQQQLINILSAIYAEPHCIILDEPTSKLDLINNVKVAQLLVQAAERDIIIIATTHDAKLANRIANRIFNLEHGKIVGHPNKISNSKEYRSAPRINYAKRFTELPEEFKCDDDDWWKYKPGGLFTEAYFDGDNSYQGYLAGEDLPRNSRTCREVDGCLHILRPPKRAVIVDVPCGWGRHSIEFARNGYKVIGVDLSPDYLTKARAKATEVASDLDIDFLQSDMRELRLPNGCADFIVNLWTSFGFFKNKEDDLRTLAEFSRILRPGGKVLIHNDLNPQMVQQGIFEEPVTRELIGGGTLRVQEYFCQEDNRVYGIWEVEASSDVKTCHQYAINVYQTEDFVNMAKKVGLEECGVYGGFSANPVSPTERDQEFIIILRKPSLDGRN